MSASLSPTFLSDLAQVYATMRPQALSRVFLSDLEKVHATLPVASDANLHSLANRLDAWRKVTKEFVRTRLAELPEDDPLRCPISLFGTMDYGRLETAHTRTLAWLLDPRREHGFAQTLLDALLCWASGDSRADGLRVERVESEFPIEASSASGRLDVLAEGSWENGKRRGWTLLIEAKVDAQEGDGQLGKYDEWLDTHAAGREVFRVFLTPDGRAPDTGAEEWESLAYLDLVQVFRSVYDGLSNAPGFHFLRFYLAGVLQDVCGFPRNVVEDAADPYAVASYLKTVHDSHSEGASYDAAR